jgi:hypothetical protein
VPKTAYVVEAYPPNGGTYMAYHVARILHIDFGYEVRVASADAAGYQRHSDNGFSYDPIFPCVPLKSFQELVREDDVLLCNPSFSALNLGVQVRGRKLMYVQGFTTYNLLDRFFDRYVAVSGFVRGFLFQTYGIEAPVIPAFVPDAGPLSREEALLADWEAKPPFSLELNVKSDPRVALHLLESVRRELRARDRDLEESIAWEDAATRSQSWLPRNHFLERLKSARYLLTLSPAEGFGLVPLEAMGMGTIVLGFDGFGGREYMVPGHNCAVADYPNIRGVVDGIILAMRDPAAAQSMVLAGVETASQYTYKAFRNAWVHELDLFLSN